MLFNLRIVKTIVLAAATCLLSSCFTLLQEPIKTLTVHTTGAASINVNTITTHTVSNKARFGVRRGKEPITIALASDSSIKPITIKQKSSFAYYTDVAYWGIGLLYRKNPKRYTFPSEIYLEKKGSVLRYTSYRPSRKGDFALHISMPYVNGFNFHPKGETVKSSIGFMGFMMGIDYYHSKKQFLSLTGGSASDFLAPVPAPVRYTIDHQRLETTWAGLTNNHKIKRLSLGYGLTYSQNSWGGLDAADSTKSVHKINYAGGVLLDAYWQFGKAFNLGVIYRPTFVGFGNNLSRYEDFMTVDFAWKIPLRR